MGLPYQFSFELPQWLQSHLNQHGDRRFANADEVMDFLVDVLAQHIRAKTGGPFASAIWDPTSGQLVSVGVNLVVPTNCSVLHGEIVALMLAQKSLQSFDLAQDPERPLALLTTGQTCIQCFGAVHWSGVTSVYQAADGADIERITSFDEGPLPPNWEEYFSNRCQHTQDKLPDIKVVKNLKAKEVCELLTQWRQDPTNFAYNAGSTRKA